MNSPAFLRSTPLLNKHPSIITHQPCCPRRPHGLRSRHRPSRLYPAATAAAASSQPPPQPNHPMWHTNQNVDLYIPKSPSLILIFTGGLAASLSPRTTYSSLLTRLSNATNAAILAHRTPPSNDHTKLVHHITNDLLPHLTTLRTNYPTIPTFTLGHSLGAKLTLLTSIDHAARQALGTISANILISFCNRSASDAVPWGNQAKNRAAATLSQFGDFLRNVDVSVFEDARAGDVRQNITNVIDAVESSLRTEFTPTPDETLALVGARYHISRNLVISFDRDELDDAPQLVRILRSRFGETGVIVRTLPGTHVTPMTPELNNGFYGTGSDQVDRLVQDVGDGVGRELNTLVAVVAAFVKLQMQIVE